MVPRALTLLGIAMIGSTILADEKTPPTITAKDREFWAFQTPKRPSVPKLSEPVRNPIDAFLLVKLQEKGLSFNPEASKEVLLRRVCFDLTGLPPTIEMAAEFFKEYAAKPQAAYEKLVDKLLASPAYGERWGRHWLDLAGYADSDGYLDADRLRPQAYRYRDYVIQAHNDDLPYSQFLTEQIAGDELSDWRRAEELTPEMIRQLTATGFLRNALDPTYPGYTEPNEIHQVISDTMQIVGTTFLGLTIQCARCHDHKFDPISHKDYYSLQNIFTPALDPNRWQPSGTRGIPMVPEAEAARIKEHNQKVTARVAELNMTLAKLTETHRKKIKNPKATEAELSEKVPEYKTEMEKIKTAVAAEQALTKELILLRGLSDIEGKPSEGRILLRGDHNKPGPVVGSAVPEVLAPSGYKFETKEGFKTSGRRLALAKWLTDPANPLTARVQVNRMWAQHFGRGIVPTVANFGKSGVTPTHPELLDYLATEFVRTGWSMKAMHRLMVNSSAYRQSSELDSAKKQADPNNQLLGRWRPRRLEGEAVRDSVLAVAGKLSEERFGPAAPVVPQKDNSVDTADDPQGNRRSVYLIVRRSKHLTLLDLFDTPMMEVNCPQRSSSTVPLQALALLNSPFSERNATALAERILKAAASDEERIAFAFKLLYTREARPSEIEKIRGFLAAIKAEQGKKPTALKDAWTQVAVVLLNSNEFVYVP
ncbi:MAG: DUF1549 and DUF1553 domain-containing protein [Planctomycetes bacterium]|nr:DUF1549 and DUF1553 domain-containing protein [Planctomycetota bacterium]